MSGKFALTSIQKKQYTSISNEFIDYYMPQANGSYVKVYLYLLRLQASGSEDSSISMIADCLEETEKDIERALKYWEKQKLVQLQRDASAAITGICLLAPEPPALAEPISKQEFSAPTKYALQQEFTASAGHFQQREFTVLTGYAQQELSTPAEPIPKQEFSALTGYAQQELSTPAEPIPKQEFSALTGYAQQKLSTPAESIPKQEFSAPSEYASQQEFTAPSEYAASSGTSKPPEEKPHFQKPNYSAAQVAELSTLPDVQKIGAKLEQILGRLLKTTDEQLILYLYESIGFSADLIIYLYEYCASKNKKSNSYIEAVAIAWAEDGIDTIEKAEISAAAFNSHYNAVNRIFGLNRIPGKAERDFMNCWFDTYGFDIPIIEEACSRSLLATNKPDFRYANRILEDWHKAGVKKKEDIAALDDEFHREKALQKVQAQMTAVSSPALNNRFHAFPQRKYTASDYSSMEEKLLNHS